MGGKILTFEADKYYNAGVLIGEAKGKAEGKAEGRAEGRAEGKVEGKVEGKILELWELVKDQTITMEKALERTGLTQEAFMERALAAMAEPSTEYSPDA